MGANKHKRTPQERADRIRAKALATLELALLGKGLKDYRIIATGQTEALISEGCRLLNSMDLRSARALVTVPLHLVLLEAPSLVNTLVVVCTAGTPLPRYDAEMLRAFLPNRHFYLQV